MSLQTPAALRPLSAELTGSPWSSPAVRPKFSWTAVAGAETYEIEVDDTCDADFGACNFPSPEIAARGLPAPRFRPEDPLPISRVRPVGRRYHWRARACANGMCSPWSPVRTVDVGRQRQDLDGDGFADILVGAPDEGGWSGRAYAYLGGATVDAVADLTIAAPSSYELGRGLAAVGDVNGDGWGDFAVSAFMLDQGQPPGSGTVLFFGSAALDSTPDLVLWRLGADPGVLSGVAGVGDVNGDGFSDLALYAPYDGVIEIFHGGPTLDHHPDRIVEAPPGYFSGITTAGDVNGDGVIDLLAGTNQSDLDGWLSGRAMVFLGDAAPGSAPWVVMKGERELDRFGFDAAGVGDLDGDGFDDVFVTCPVWSSKPQVGDSRADLFLGGAAMDGLPDLRIWGMDLLSTQVAPAGDQNGDGLPDLLIGNGSEGYGGLPGNAFVVLGGSPLDAVRDIALLPSPPPARFGDGVAEAGDVNGDGFVDLLVAAHPGEHGRGRVYLFLGGPILDAVPDAILEGKDAHDGFGWTID